jgi:hypothetical protein
VIGRSSGRPAGIAGRAATIGERGATIGERGATIGERAAAALAGLMLIALTIAGAGPAAAAARPVSDCTATSGVILAVDFGPWGGPLLRSCGSTPTTGYALLNQGGWHTVGTEHDGPGFICRISYSGYRHDVQYPTPAQQACVQTPPANAYWAFWHAGPGQTSWTYSENGAVGYDPAPGSSSLWVFGGTNLGGTAGSAVPKLSPQQLRAAPVGTATAGGPEIVNAPPVSASVSVSRGSAWPTLLAAATAVLLVAAGVVGIARRRRLARS